MSRDSVFRRLFPDPSDMTPEGLERLRTAPKLPRGKGLTYNPMASLADGTSFALGYIGRLDDTSLTDSVLFDGDPPAPAAVPRVEVAEVRTVVEWRCHRCHDYHEAGYCPED